MKMKKICHKMGSLTVCLAFLFSILALPASALATEEYDSFILAQLGIPQEIIDVMPESDIQDLVAAYIADPNSVEVSTSTFEIDVLSEMQTFSSKSRSELLALGYTKEQISRGKEIIDAYNEASDEELLGTGMKQEEINTLRTVLSSDSSIVPRGQISSARLTFTQTSTDYSSSSMANYLIGIYFNWSSPYIWTIYEDKIVVAWGGDLKHVQDYQSILYYETTFFQTEYTSCAGVADASYEEIAVNAMGMYTFHQGYSNVVLGESGVVKSGSLRYQLYQTTNSGRVSKAIAYYAHQVAQYTGSISFTGTGVAPAISIGTGYDTIYAESGITY